MSQPRINIRSNKSTIIFATATIIIVFLIGIIAIKNRNQCSLPTISLPDDWRYSDLRVIDPVEQEIPNLDIVAVYTRVTCDQLQLRLDILDYIPSHQSDILISFNEFQPSIVHTQEIFDTTSGYTFFIPHGDNQHITTRNQGVVVYIDTFQDAIYISFPLEGFPSKSYPKEYFVMTRSSLDLSKIDSVGPIEITGTPPPPITILLAFRDTFQANTPGQALRSWDGAHTGPDSTRHGLRHLLTAADRHNIPITLLDFDSPENFTALEYLDTTDWFLQLKERGVVLFLEKENICNVYAQFLGDPVQAGASYSGVSPELLTVLLNSNLYLELTPTIVPLCISLQNSYWGVPEAVDNTLLYISQHPWMRPINQGDVDSLSSNASTHGIIPQEFNPRLERLLYFALGELNKISTNHLTELARDEIAEILRSDRPNLVLRNREQYSHIGHLIKAAEWSNSPSHLTSCNLDIDWDGEAECILATDRIFASFELSEGSLATMFYQGQNGIHQIVGLRSQLQSFANGLPDTYSTPGETGNLAKKTEEYLYKFDSSSLELYSRDMAMRKTFRVREDTLEIRISEASENHDLLIPVILDPWVLSKNDWADLYSVEKFGEEWHLSLGNLVSLRLSTASNANVASFISPRSLMGYAEDPNQNYSQGYFLPFPLSVITLGSANTNNQEVKLELTISTK